MNSNNIVRHSESSRGTEISSECANNDSHNLSNFRISPNVITRSNSNTIEINTETLLQDISRSLDPIKENLVNNLDHTILLDNLKVIMAEIFTEYSRQIVVEITKQIQDVVALNETIRVLESNNETLVKRNKEIEYNLSMVLTGNAFH